MTETFQSDHTSITQIPQLIEYCNNVSEDGEQGKYPCDDAQYYHSILMTGFEDSYNPYDPRVICNQDTDTTCPDENNIYIFRDSETIDGTFKYRFFVPKGTHYLDIYINLGFGVSNVAASIRFGKQPTIVFPESYDDFENFSDYPELFNPDDYPNIDAFTDGKSITQLNEKDWYSIVKTNYNYLWVTSGIISTDESGWIYFEFKNYNSATINGFNVNWYGYKDEFIAWYNSADFSVNGDPPEISISDPDPLSAVPTSLSFGFVPVNTQSVEKTITITNESGQPITIIPSISDGFSLHTDVTSIYLATGESINKNVRFDPTSEKSYTGNLTLTANGQTMLTVPLTGTSIYEPLLTADPTSLIFGYVPVNTHSTEKTVSITNNTDESITLTPSISSGFSVPAGLSSFSIASNESVNKSIRFDPIAEQLYNGTLTFSADGETMLTVPLSGTSAADPNPTGEYRKSNPNLVYDSTGKLYLFYDLVTRMDLDQSEITNIFYTTSSDHGNTWSTPIAVTSSDKMGNVNCHPYAAINVSEDITLAYTKNVSSLLTNGDTYGWCESGYYSRPSDLHFDASTGKLYAILTWAVIVIDTINWEIEKCYSSSSSPAFSDYWDSINVNYKSNQGGSHYVSVGAKQYAMIIDHNLKTITQYNFADNNEYSLLQNIDVDWRDWYRSYEIIGTHIDADENRLYITWYSEYSGNIDLIFGFIDISETPDVQTDKYTWHEIFYRPDDINAYITPGTSTIVKESDIVMISFYGLDQLQSEGGLLVYSLSSGNLIKKYFPDSFSSLPKWGMIHPVYYDKHIYAHFTYESNYGQENKRGLVDIDTNNDSIQFITPSYASGVNDYLLNRKIATGDGRLIISTNGYGIQIFNISTGEWVEYDNAKIPGLTPNGSDSFNDIEYDSATGNIFASSGNGGWYGIIMFNEAGSYKQVKYREGTFTGGDHGTESSLTIGLMDYEMAVIKDSADTLWGVWTRQDDNELSLKWDNELATIDLCQYLTGSTTVSWDLESTGKLDFSVASGHLFDQFNLSSSLNPVLAKGRKIILELGEVISGVETWQGQGTFTVMEKSMSYKRGEHPVMKVRCEDVRSMWDQANITATEYYSEQHPEDVLYDLVSTHANLSNDLIDLPSAGAMTDSHTIDHQWLDTKLMDCIRDILDHFGYFPYFDTTGKFTIRRVNLEADPSHTYTNADMITEFSPDDSYGNFVNQVIVKGEGRYFIEVTYAEEMITSDSGTLGWWGCNETRQYYFSDDHEKKCQNPRVVITQSPTINVLFVEKGGGEITLSYIDPDGYYVEVYIAAPDLIMVVVTSILALIAMAAVAMTCTLNCGYFIFACMVLVSVVFYLLAAVANYAFEIYAFPTGEEKQTFQAQADDLDLQRELGFITKTEIDDPFCYDVATCQKVADKEMAVVKAQRNRITFQKIAHLQDEIGDTIQIVHPYSNQTMTVFVTSISRSYSKPDGSGDGGMIDSIEGWVL